MRKYKFYYYYSYSFADAISPVIIERLLKRKIRSKNGFDRFNSKSNALVRHVKSAWKKIAHDRFKSPRVLGLGSIFHHAVSHDIVWGSGVNPHYQDQVDKVGCTNIRATRGPLSRSYLQERYGLQVPEVYGDPALLMPQLFPEFKRQRSSRKLLILAQHNDEKMFQGFVGEAYSKNVLKCQRYNRLHWREVVCAILQSEFVVSSSLHGLIIADAFNVPSRWLHHQSLPSSVTEGRFKFNDYYLSTGRPMDCYASSVEEALLMGPTGKISDFDGKKLIDAFPFECF